ncbi:HEAT repeat domain-containing protein [Paraglaciecola arctica]|nr:HEAT repeat domain-containing protein [Paraglaciecola arctica]
MSKSSHFFTLALAFAAFLLAASCFYLQVSQAPLNLSHNALSAEEQAVSIGIASLPITSAGNSKEVHMQRLQQTLNALNQRLITLENTLSQAPVSEQVVTQMIETYVAQREQQLEDERLSNNPFQSFYETLPDDYEQKLKTDPDYAAKIQQELKHKVLDNNLSDEKRLEAMTQLQITSGILSTFSPVETSNLLSEAIMDIANSTNDEKTRIRALETITSGTVANAKLAPTFINLLNNDPNHYVRNLAANGLSMMMFSREIDSSHRQQLANQILQTMKTTSDNELKTILEQNFGIEQDMQNMLKHMQEQVSD